jgi:hypothetical protein
MFVVSSIEVQICLVLTTFVEVVPSSNRAYYVCQFSFPLLLCSASGIVSIDSTTLIDNSLSM